MNSCKARTRRARMITAAELSALTGASPRVIATLSKPGTQYRQLKRGAKFYPITTAYVAVLSDLTKLVLDRTLTEGEATDIAVQINSVLGQVWNLAIEGHPYAIELTGMTKTGEKTVALSSIARAAESYKELVFATP